VNNKGLAKIQMLSQNSKEAGVEIYQWDFSASIINLLIIDFVGKNNRSCLIVEKAY
jgi:hypothetical protein